MSLIRMKGSNGVFITEEAEIQFVVAAKLSAFEECGMVNPCQYADVRSSIESSLNKNILNGSVVIDSNGNLEYIPLMGSIIFFKEDPTYDSRVILDEESFRQLFSKDYFKYGRGVDRNRFIREYYADQIENGMVSLVRGFRNGGIVFQYTNNTLYAAYTMLSHAIMDSVVRKEYFKFNFMQDFTRPMESICGFRFPIHNLGISSNIKTYLMVLINIMLCSRVMTADQADLFLSQLDSLMLKYRKIAVN